MAEETKDTTQTTEASITQKGQDSTTITQSTGSLSTGSLSTGNANAAGTAEQDEKPAQAETQEADGAKEADGTAHNALQKAEKAAEEKPEGEAAGAPDKAALEARVLSAELRAAAALAGVPAAKIPHLVRMADLEAAKDAKDLAAFAAAQVQAILKDVPELGAQAAGTGSAGNHARKQEPTKDPFLKGFGG